MSYWKAAATVRDIPKADHSERLREALETLHAVAEALDVDPDNTGRALGFPTDLLVKAIEDLQDDVEKAKEEAEESDNERIAAESKLEEHLQKPAEQKFIELSVALEIAKRTAARDREERDEALARLAKTETLVESYSDFLAMARKFVAASECAGVPTKHVRRSKGSK